MYDKRKIHQSWALVFFYYRQQISYLFLTSIAKNKSRKDLTYDHVSVTINLFYTSFLYMTYRL